MLNNLRQFKFLAVFILLGLTDCAKGLFVALITEGHVYVVEPHDTVTLECNFHADQYDLFDYPVLWRKRQHIEDSQVNVMGILMDPFSHCNRFEVTFDAFDSRYRLMLHIRGVKNVDSGNYTCEIRTPEANILGGVTHRIFVRESVESVVITLNNSTWISSDANKQHHVELVEGIPVFISCTATGGYPAPHVTIRIGGNDITHTFEAAVNQTLLRGNGRGLRYIKNEIHLRAPRYVPQLNVNEQVLYCLAEVTGLQVAVQQIQLVIYYAPKITCHFASAYLDDDDANIRCAIMSNPRVLNFYWTIGTNGTYLSEAETLSEYRTTAKAIPGNNTVDVRLVIKRIRAYHFQLYRMSATNAVGTSSHGVELVQRHKDTTKTSDGATVATDVSPTKSRHLTYYSGNTGFPGLVLTNGVLGLQLLTNIVSKYTVI